MEIGRVKDILEGFRGLSIGVVGDFCIDAYWLLDESNIELSIETGKPTHAVANQSYHLGGAGNVVSNLVSLGVGRVFAFGVVGKDVFGREMINLLEEIKADTSGIVVQEKDWDTSVYAKPYIDLDEQERIDFGRFNKLSDEIADKLISKIEEKIPELNGLIINQQLRCGIHSEYFISKLQKLIDKYQDKVFLLDARDVSDRYRNVICKVNAVEAARLCGEEKEVTSAITVEEIKEYAQKIYKKTNRVVIITRSDRGIYAYDGGNSYEVPGVLITDPVDPVGAGDTVAATIVSVLSLGGSVLEAITLGNISASVVVRKLRQTGTACPEEIIQLAEDIDYVYRPELAEDIRKAKYLDNTEIEIINSDIKFGKIRHIIFDHDGTISTLREGWESIMEPVMVKAILGDQYYNVPEEVYRRIVNRVRDYIEQSTGIETIVQMEKLVEMVNQFGFVPKDKILDALGYKAIYNQALLEMVNKRIAKLERGELDVEDFTIKGAVEFIKRLYGSGIKLYLASGTDHKDVVKEAEILGYAKYFEGRIYGWAGKGTGSAKKIVIRKILDENKLSGSELLCIGDGPVELRLTKKVGGVAIGLASDEIRRFGLNTTKRARLIKAGADIIVPDYSQQNRLVELLGISS